MSSSDIFVGLGLTLLLAATSQILAARIRVPAIVVLLPVGFFAGHFISDLDPNRTLGAAFSPLVSLAVALIVFDAGLDLTHGELVGEDRRVWRLLYYVGIPMTAASAALFAWLLLDISSSTAIMLGAILIVSGPTVVTPLLETAHADRRVSRILKWEATSIDPTGAVIAAVVFQAIDHHGDFGGAVLSFLGSIGVGVLGGVIGTVVLWWLLTRLRLSGALAAQAVLAVVLGAAALCNAWRDETGLLAAVLIGIAVARLPRSDLAAARPALKSIVDMDIGLLFISISATVTVASVRAVVWPTIVLIAALILIARPVVTALATFGSSLSLPERAFMGWMDPRGIVAASSAATFAAPLAAAGIGGADKLLPVTFLVIVGTVMIYGLSATAVVQRLGLRDPAEQSDQAAD
jgi:NhaP-type Na+/H+ or K+/H+ antiporter